MNFLDSLKRETNITVTENGATAHKSTLRKVYDMFAFGGAYRTHNDGDCILLFKNALAEDESLALKCLFYLRDCRGGQGERRFFRVCYKWLCTYQTEIAKRNLTYVSEYGRWDDLIYVALGTPLERDMLEMIKQQLLLDMDSKTPSLLGKWVPSINASSKTTIKTAHIIRKFLGMTNKEYRKMLAMLRTKINIVEKLMSENRWDEIEFDKLPSKAGLKYKNAFAARDILAKRYAEFAKSDAKVNAATVYPYEVVKQALDNYYVWDGNGKVNEEIQTRRNIVNKYWENLPDYINGNTANAICVCDTSGSMTSTYGTSIRPIDVAISLSLYMAERNKGDFANHYISFASEPQLIECEGLDFVDKVYRIYKTNLIDNTNLDAVFALLKETALKTSKEGLPERIIVISDMEIDEGSDCYWGRGNYHAWTSKNTQTNMERIREEWAEAGLTLPKLVYWNVCARNNIILDGGDDVSFVSGASPVLFEQICKGVTGWELCLEKLMSERYSNIK